MLRLARAAFSRLSPESKEDVFLACNRLFCDAPSFAELSALYIAFFSGVLHASVDHQGPPMEETDELAPALIALCREGFIPTCSQPARANQKPFVEGMVDAARATRVFDGTVHDERFWVCVEMPDGTVRTNAPFNPRGFYTVSRSPSGNTTHLSRTDNRDLFLSTYDTSRLNFANHAHVWVAARDENSPTHPVNTVLAIVSQ